MSNSLPSLLRIYCLDGFQKRPIFIILKEYMHDLQYKICLHADRSNCVLSIRVIGTYIHRYSYTNVHAFSQNVFRILNNFDDRCPRTFITLT